MTIPAVEGEITILPSHIALFTRVKPGEIHYLKGKEQRFMAVNEGFLEVLNDKINILTDYAVRSEEVEVAKAEEAKKRAQVALREKKSGQDFVVAEAQLRKAILDLKVAKRGRGRVI